MVINWWLNGCVFFHLEEWEKKTTNMGIEHDWTEDCKNTAAILTIRTQWNCPHAELKLQSYEILYIFILNNNRKTYNYNFNLQPKKKDTWIYIYCKLRGGSRQKRSIVQDRDIASNFVELPEIRMLSLFYRYLWFAFSIPENNGLMSLKSGLLPSNRRDFLLPNCCRTVDFHRCWMDV
jgi:hypothetical protein